MNKSVIITLAVVVGLLAFWLILVVMYPVKNETTEQTTNSVINTAEQGVVPQGDTTQSISATVMIVEQPAEANKGLVEAQVTLVE